MKIEKLTENKIRVIINLEDFKNTNTNIENIAKPSAEARSFLLDILLKAEKEVGFHTDGCKLLIEAFSSSDGVCIFTITKYTEKDSIKDNLNSLFSNNISGRKLVVKRKELHTEKKNMIYSFENFETFCDFCNNIYNMKEINVDSVSKNISLFLYNDTYYLTLSNINIKYKNLKLFYSCISEFAKSTLFSEHFQNKLQEHGTTIIKKKAISTGIKYFALK